MRIWFNRGFSLAPIAGLMRAADPALDVYVSVSPHSARYPGPTETWVDGGPEGAAGRDPDAYLEWVRATITAHAIDLFVPTRHRAMLAAADLPCRVHLPASAEVLRLLDDKFAFAEALAGEDYHLPTHLVRSAGDLEALIAQWPADGAGLCVKPRNGVNGLGFWRLDDVDPMLHLQQPDWRKIQPAQYLAALREQEARGPLDEIVAMAFLPGPEISFDILAERGRLLKYAARTKLANGHQQIASSHPLEPAVAAAVARFALHGLVNAQFRRAIDGGWKLLEINARPAGGVVFADQVGCRLVADWAGLLTGRLSADTIDRRAIDTEVAFTTVVQELAGTAVAQDLAA